MENVEPLNGGIEARECRAPAERSRSQLAELNALIQSAKSLPHYARAWGGSGPLASLTDLEKHPILRKADLIDIQPAYPPFGGLMAESSGVDYLFISPGPILEPGFMNPEFWRLSRALQAAGFGRGDIVHNTFSYHLTPGAWMLDSGARALGCSVIPAGNASIDLQVSAIYQFGASAYVGTPDFLKTLIEHCQLADRGPVPFQKALVSGGALTPGLREFFKASKVEALQCYATAELGLIAYEADTSGQMIVDEDVIVEIVDPGTGEAMPFGEVGEVVVTTLREDYPLIRFGTGDLSAFIPDEKRSPGIGARSGAVLAGWLGRADQATKVRGMFIRPSQLSGLTAQIDGLERIRLVVGRENEKDELMLFCELKQPPLDEAAITHEIANSFRNLCQLKTKVTLVETGSIADDGKLIADVR